MRLVQVNLICQSVRQYVREHGISADTGEVIERMLKQKTQSFKYNLDACQFAGQLIDFFNEQSKIVPQGQIWIGSVRSSNLYLEN